MKDKQKRIAVAAVLFIGLAYIVIFNLLYDERAVADTKTNVVYTGSEAITAFQSETATETTIYTETVYIININTADIAELITLEGIGEVTAQAILDYRTVNGDFTAIEQIMEVKGIGPAKFEAIKEHITVGDEAENKTEVIQAEDKKVNLNTASMDELMTFDGVGEVLAGRIIEYRETFGFRSVEDLKNVDGIGDVMYERLAPFAEV
ncbi:MAG: helix-hairpin-helix domain-containing protein [Ruminococcus sp.]|jgi:competence protein ComEA|nr:helix-hairpin-helix domain-containing protein [Ruminococcus sp.]